MSEDNKITVVLYKRSQKDKKGIIKIEIYNSLTQRQKYVSLKESIEEIYWNYKEKRVKKTHNRHIDINNKIQNELRKIEANNNTAYSINGNDITFKTYSDIFLKYQKEWGSFKKYNSIINHFLKFINTYYSKEDIKLKDITEQVIADFEHYFLDTERPIKYKEPILKVNTVIKYLKLHKAIIAKAIKDNYVNYLRHPYLTTKMNKVESEKDYLLEDEIFRIINLDIDTYKDLKLVRLMSLVQLFSNGIRVSDLLLLRFSHIADNKMAFRMRKTKKYIIIPINDRLKEYIVESLEFHDIESEEVEERYEVFTDTLKILKSTKLKQQLQKKDYSKPLEAIKNNLERAFNDLINELKRELNDEFVFPILSSSDFPNDIRERFSKYQFNQLSSKTVMYNKALKTLGEAIKTNKKLTSHIFRHSFANIALNVENPNLYEISKSLGHSSLRQTEEYLRNFDSEKVRLLADKVAGRFDS